MECGRILGIRCVSMCGSCLLLLVHLCPRSLLLGGRLSLLTRPFSAAADIENDSCAICHNQLMVACTPSCFLFHCVVSSMRLNGWLSVSCRQASHARQSLNTHKNALRVRYLHCSLFSE